MKTTRFIILFLIAVLLGSCFGPWNGEENSPSGKGTLSIVWGNNTAVARSFVQESDIQGFSYNVVLTGPGETQDQTFTGVPSATFTVIPGTWTVTVKGYQSTTNGDYLRVMGIEQIEVTPGPNAAKPVAIYTASEAGSWAYLENIILSNDTAYAREPSREELIIIKNSFNFNILDNTIYINRPVILIAESNVTIGRSEPATTTGFVFPSFFCVGSGGTLTLGKPGMTGTLTINNRNEKSESLVKVNSGTGSGRLIVNNGVTITGGNVPAPDRGGGVYV